MIVPSIDDIFNQSVEESAATSRALANLIHRCNGNEELAADLSAEDIAEEFDSDGEFASKAKEIKWRLYAKW